jgi:DNA-directed RNA polymerase subunit RPC12/RpoP
MKKPMPQFMMVYKCSTCGLESGYTELDEPACRFCEEKTTMTLESKQELTPEVMAARLKAVTDSMMKNLESAFHSLTEEDKNTLFGDKDAEGEMLKLLAKSQQLKNKIQGLELKDPNNDRKKDE